MRKFQKNLIPKPSIAPPKWLMSPTLPKELEIGAGNGEFAIHKAKSMPNTHFIAIEKSHTRFHLMQNQCQKHQLPNLWPFHTNAVWWITHFVPKNSLNSIYILYPNPYTKNKQKNLRWYNRPFMPYLLDRLKKGGTLEISTNQQNYYKEAKQKMGLYPHISQKKALTIIPPKKPKPNSLNHKVANKKSPLIVKNTLAPHTSGRTTFERKYLNHGEKCWSLVYTKL